MLGHFTYSMLLPELPSSAIAVVVGQGHGHILGRVEVAGLIMSQVVHWRGHEQAAARHRTRMAWRACRHAHTLLPLCHTIVSIMRVGVWCCFANSGRLTAGV
jgi:hypothetical protein